jgi:hypothetical protein
LYRERFLEKSDDILFRIRVKKEYRIGEKKKSADNFKCPVPEYSKSIRLCGRFSMWINKYKHGLFFLMPYLTAFLSVRM